MSLLMDKGLAVLGTFTGSIASGANPTLYTTPTGKVTRIVALVFRDPSGSAAAATAITCTGFSGTISLANLITANTGYVVVFNGNTGNLTPAQATEIAAATAVVLTTTTGAAVTVTVDVIGFTS